MTTTAAIDAAADSYRALTIAQLLHKPAAHIQALQAQHDATHTAALKTLEVTMKQTPATQAANARLHRDGTAYDTGHRDGSSGAPSRAEHYPRTLHYNDITEILNLGSVAVAQAIQDTRTAYTKGYNDGQQAASES